MNLYYYNRFEMNFRSIASFFFFVLFQISNLLGIVWIPSIPQPISINNFPRVVT